MKARLLRDQPIVHISSIVIYLLILSRIEYPAWTHFGNNST